MLFAALSLGFVSCDNKGNEPDDPATEQGSSSSVSGTENGHEWVDLGLPSGLKWATCNVGATKPEEYGNYYAWGEVEPKEVYNWGTYKWCNGSSTTLTKYCTDSDYGTVDNKIILNPEDDAATINMGGSWRMPTKEEYQELIDESTWTWTDDYNGTVVGLIGTSKTNGNHIFLPAAGVSNDNDFYYVGLIGNYHSSSVDINPSTDNYGLGFDGGLPFVGSSCDRCYGHSVRGVME